MTQTAPPTTDSDQTQQFMLFDLGETITPSTPTGSPRQRETAPITSARSNKHNQRPTAKTGTQPTPAAPVRLEIAPMPTLPELPPLQLAAVRAALYQALAEQAQAAYEELLTTIPDGEPQHTPAIATERIAAAARLLSESSVLNAAVSLLALEAPA